MNRLRQGEQAHSCKTLRVIWDRLEGIESLTVDYEHGHVEVNAVDGRIVREPGRSWASLSRRGPLDFKRVVFRPGELVLTMVTPWDEELEAEVYALDDQLMRRRGRPVIYLDQNKWVQVALAVHRPDRVHPPELSPTLRLIDLARARQVILPVSSGHWIETGPIYGPRRSHLAALMVGLSRGWIMRDPIRVASSEIEAMLARGVNEGILPAPAAVFTVDSRQLYAESTPGYVSNDANLPPQIVSLINALSGVQAVLAVLLENERTQDPDGVEAARKWAAVHQDLANRIASQPRVGPAALRRLTLVAFVMDLGHGLEDAVRASGLGSADFQTWLDLHADSDIGRLPYIGRRREVTHLRLGNADDSWEPNDLIDMLFLPCAAGYADFVICENHTGAYLRRVARDLPEGATVCTSIRELLAALEV